jgi:hypothetical protein
VGPDVGICRRDAAQLAPLLDGREIHVAAATSSSFTTTTGTTFGSSTSVSTCRFPPATNDG